MPRGFPVPIEVMHSMTTPKKMLMLSSSSKKCHKKGTFKKLLRSYLLFFKGDFGGTVTNSFMLKFDVLKISQRAAKLVFLRYSSLKVLKFLKVWLTNDLSATSPALAILAHTVGGWQGLRSRLCILQIKDKYKYKYKTKYSTWFTFDLSCFTCLEESSTANFSAAVR